MGLALLKMQTRFLNFFPSPKEDMKEEKCKANSLRSQGFCPFAYWQPSRRFISVAAHSVARHYLHQVVPFREAQPKLSPACKKVNCLVVGGFGGAKPWPLLNVLISVLVRR
jgi:hypothetical protein